MDRSHNISNRLKHRIAQMLLTSSCTTTTIMNISEKISQERGSPFSDFHVHRGCELDQRPHRVAPVVQVSIDCSGRRSIHASPSPNLPLTPEEENRYQKKERRVTESGVVYETGAGEGRKCPPASPSLPSNDNYYYSCSKQRKKAMAEKKNKFVSKKKKPLSNGYGISGSCSIGSNDEFGFFSSEEGEEEEEEEEEEETWTLFSSKSFSSDSSEFYHRPSSKKTTKHKKSTRRPPRRGARYFEESWDEGSKFQPLIPISSKKKPPKAAEARTGFAVVKQSTNPYEDFRSSMVEMITEREMREPEELERLLHSYLSLNSPCHHPAILEAFADLWEAIFRRL
ncbi:transcription repressor OFP1 [Cocos nucifera]|uniref:Transcription repressor OFP1 n=1 Tax=Cocos nucifera TaxID=13894 RepID=A0A8K0N2Y6_COCNU|nr:transcription repressor OFP1 [Cocos nucifera]